MDLPKVGKLSWRAYRQIKQTVVKSLLAKVIPLLQDQDLTSKAFWLSIVDVAGAMLFDELDELAEAFVSGCCGGVDCSAFSVAEFAELQRQAFELNPIEVILETEKNSLAGVLFQQIQSLRPANTGGPALSEPPYDPGGDMDIS